MKPTVGIIGAGLGGLSAAIYLANAGFNVKIFEKNDKFGGKLSYIHQDGYYFDIGPTLLTMPFVVEHLFETVGEKFNEYLDIIKIEPACRNFFSDGTYLDTSSDLSIMKSELNKIYPSAATDYENFLHYSKKLYDNTADIFLFEPFQEIRYLLKKRSIPIQRVFHLDAFRTINETNRSFFQDDRLVQLFNRFATYNGSSPYLAPATLNVIPYVEYGLGAYYIKGGMYKLVEALQNLAMKLGVEINLNCEIKEILIEKKVAKGISYSGKKEYFDYIICNSDVVQTFNSLINGFEKEKEKLNKLEPSLSGMLFLWGVKGKTDLLKHHNVFFSDDYFKEFKQIFDEQKAPDDPTIYISISSKSNPEHSPSNSENWYVLLNMPYLNPSQNWDFEVKKMRLTILNKLKKFGLDIENKIEFERVLAPKEFYDLYRSNKGSIYGISSNSRMTAFKRPANRNRSIKNLYFATGSAHPGGGIPLAILSGKHCSDLIQFYSK
ncbi:MAG: phytoene desaturase family protein [Candidatus Kapabacteria bacterium]|nr:phytoene desaturase family protein [Candidatus Kapabacteria bacterium]